MNAQRWQVGMHVTWETLGGDKYEGTIFEVEDDEVHIHCSDGEDRAVTIV